MSDIGFKLSPQGKDVRETAVKDLLLSSGLPVPKCDLRPNPKRYGLVNLTIGSLAAGTSAEVLRVDHNYNYVPAYLSQWDIPDGTNPFDTTSNITYSIGDADLAFNNGLYLNMRTDNKQFLITATNFGGAAITNFQATIRFYIFAEDFPVAT